MAITKENVHLIREMYSYKRRSSDIIKATRRPLLLRWDELLLRRSVFFLNRRIELGSYHYDAVVFHTVLIGPFFRLAIAFNGEQSAFGQLAESFSVFILAPCLEIHEGRYVQLMMLRTDGFLRYYLRILKLRSCSRSFSF